MNLLFLCPHSAAKSVLATSIANREIERRRLPIHTTFAGTEPDAQIMPAVVARLNADGIDLANQRPRLVTAEDLETADYIISLGCTSDELNKILAGVDSRVEFWNDVPPVSQNLPIAYAVIEQRVQSLLENMSAA